MKSEHIQNRQHRKMRKPRHSVVQKAYQCEFCHVKCRRPQDLRRHSFVHTEASFQCDGCGNKFTRYDTLMRHKRDNCRNSQSAWPEKRKSGKTIDPDSPGSSIAAELPEVSLVDSARAKRHRRQRSSSLSTPPANAHDASPNPSAVLPQYGLSPRSSYTSPRSNSCPEGQSLSGYPQFTQPWYLPQSLPRQISPDSATSGVLNMVPSIIPNHGLSSPLTPLSGLAPNPSTNRTLNITPNMTPNMASSMAPSMAPSMTPAVAPSMASNVTPNLTQNVASPMAMSLPNIVPGMGAQIPSGSTNGSVPGMLPNLLPSMAPSMSPSLTLGRAPVFTPGPPYPESYAAPKISSTSGLEEILVPSDSIRTTSQSLPNVAVSSPAADNVPTTPPKPSDLPRQSNPVVIHSPSSTYAKGYPPQARSPDTSCGLQVSPYQSQAIPSASPPFDSSSRLPRIQKPRSVDSLSTHKNNLLQPLEPNPLRTGPCCATAGHITPYEGAN